MENPMVSMKWNRDGVSQEVTFSLRDIFIHEDIRLIPSFKQLEHGYLYTLTLTLEKPIIIEEFSTLFTPDAKNYTKMMVNGFQTWTQSKEMGQNEQILPLRRVVRHLLSPYGDYQFMRSPESGKLYSWTYSYLRSLDGLVMLLGSIDESFAYTVLEYDYQREELWVRKEVKDLVVEGNCIPFQIYVGEGEELNLWAEYFSQTPSYRQPVAKSTGWTSWYNYYTEITEDILLDNLKTLRAKKIPLDVFQIDDGYQRALGDWLEVNDKFPSGMQALASQIKATGFRPGLWLAPFVCDKESLIYREHPEWLLKDHKGRLVKAGWNPGWNGWFYSLDLYAPGFQDYLRQVFATVLDEWGYEMVKLDFLYAVALRPRSNKSRGKIMTEALDFLREVIGDRWILGCGVPLGPSFGQVDYCRIGSDVAPYWEDNKLAFVNYRERVSTYNSLLSTLSRWQLNSGAFLNDPDVFILRDRDNKLTKDERYTLFVLNNLFGGLVFFSDHIGEYSKEQQTWLHSMYPVVNPVIRVVEEKNQVYHVCFYIDDREYHLYSNLSSQPIKLEFKGPAFIAEQGYVSGDEEIILNSHQTVCLCYYYESEKHPVLLGSLGHIFPGAQVKSFIAKGEIVEIILHDNCSPESKIYIASPPRMTNLKINNKFYSVKLNSQGLRYVCLSPKELI